MNMICVDAERVLITPKDEADWLAMRAFDVTSTECAALFNCHSYGLTEFSLYHHKKGGLVTEFKENERMAWGKRLEAAIAVGIAEDLGLIVESFKDYGRVPSARMGSSFDFKVVGISDTWAGGDETYRDLFRVHGQGILEVKNVDGMIFRRGWLDEAGRVEAPPQIEMQIQHQLEVSGLGWCLGAPLVNGNTPKPFYRLRDKDIGAAIRAKVAAFWARIEANDEPAPDFDKDGNDLASLYLNNNGQTIDLDQEQSAHLEAVCAAYSAASEDGKAADKRKAAARAEILSIIKDYAKADVGQYKITAGTVEENDGTLVTPEMVGTYVGARPGHQLCLVYTKDSPGKLITPEMVGTFVKGRSAYRNMRITLKKS